MADSIGIMEGAFFISKADLLGWMNELLKLNLTKIEQLGTGSVYCQILDACYPGEINLSKVNFRAKLEWEFVNNFKVLQQAFDKYGITRHIEVEKLVKCRPLDNIEFGQWMKRFYEIKCGTNIRDYDAVGRRGKAEPDFSFCEKGVKDSSKKTKPIEQQSNPTLVKKTKIITEPAPNTMKAEKSSGKELFKGVDMKLEDPAKIKNERDALKEKLKTIEKLLRCEEADELIIKGLREYLGIKYESNKENQSSGFKNSNNGLDIENEAGIL